MKVLNFKAYSKRIEEIKAMQDKQGSGVIYIAADTWLESDDESSCFAEYANKLMAKASDKAIIILDDMGMGSNGLYLPNEPLHFLDRASLKPFMECFNDAKWLEMYIEVVASRKDFFSNIENAAFQDFLQNYETMSISKMVERYSMQKWFTGRR